MPLPIGKCRAGDLTVGDPSGNFQFMSYLALSADAIPRAPLRQVRPVFVPQRPNALGGPDPVHLY
jgi:hypothetical protein